MKRSMLFFVIDITMIAFIVFYLWKGIGIWWADELFSLMLLFEIILAAMSVVVYIASIFSFRFKLPFDKDAERIRELAEMHLTIFGRSILVAWIGIACWSYVQHEYLYAGLVFWREFRCVVLMDGFVKKFGKRTKNV